MKIQLIKDSIGYIENRIHFVDRKATLLLAIEVGVITATLWVVENLLHINFSELSCIQMLCIVFISILTFTIQLCLLQTIRPTSYFFSNRTNVKNKGKHKGVMWPKNLNTTDFTEFCSTVKGMSDIDIENEYLSTLYTSRLLVDRKYTYYRFSVFLIKWQMLIISIILFFTGIPKLWA